MSYFLISVSISVFGCGCPLEFFGHSIVFVRSGAEDAIVSAFNFSSSLIFLLLGSTFPSSSWRGPIPAHIVELFFRKFVEKFGVYKVYKRTKILEV